MSNVKSYKLIILTSSVIIIILFDALYSISSIVLNIEDIFHFNKFEDSLFDKTLVNVFLISVSFISLKLSYGKYDWANVFQFDRNLYFFVPLAIIIGIITNIFGVFVVDLFTATLEDFGHGESVASILSDIDTNLQKLIYISIVGIIIPIIEEVYMRLYAYNILREKFNIFITILLSTIIFLLFHINLSLFPFVIIANVVLCLSYEYTKNLIVPITIHMTINIYSLI